MHIRIVEHEAPYTLEVCEVHEDGGDVTLVPIINRWIQLAIDIKRVPSSLESRSFFRTLAKDMRALTTTNKIYSWFFLHKPPGLRIRIHLASVHPALSTLIHKVATWDYEWMQGLSFESYFGHAELVSGAYPVDLGALLMASASEYCRALLANRQATRTDWPLFTVHYLDHFLADRWLVWEALGRLERLREYPFRPSDIKQRRQSLMSPKGLLARVRRAPQPASPGFQASTALLQSLNYIYNQWLLNVASQKQVLSVARQLAMPELLKK
jgi:hypothetical protein